MMVHVLSGQWPFPGEAVRVNPRNPNNPNDLVGVTEFDRREEYINLIGNEHPLMTLIQGCLSNSPSHRPTSSEVHQTVSAVAADHPPFFTNRVEMIDRIKALSDEKETMRLEKDSAIAQKDTAIMERDRSIAELNEIQSDFDSLCQSHSIHVQALEIINTALKADTEHLQTTIIAKEENYKKEKQALEDEHRAVKKAVKQQYQAQLESKMSEHQAQLESKMSELSTKNALILSKTSTIRSLQEKFGQALGTSSRKDNLSVFSPGVKLTFTECAKLPQSIGGLDQGVVIGKNVYIGVGLDRSVLKYNIVEDIWNTLPMAPVKFARIRHLCKKVLIVGGLLTVSDQVTADIHEFDEASQQWVRSTSIPPMPTARSSVTAISWSSPPALIVCGGHDRKINPMTVVEIYHSKTSQWHAVSPLPFPRFSTTHTVVHNMLYLRGGYEGNKKTTIKKTLISTSIPQLLESCLQPSPTQWQSLPVTDVPKYRSTAASLGGCLLILGGAKDPSWPPKPESIVSSMHAYCPFTSSWVLVGQLPQPLCACVTATLPTGELLVIGGRSSSGDTVMATNTTYKCSMSM